MLKNMKIKKSLVLGYAITIVIAVAIILACMFMMMNQREEYELLLNEDVETNESILFARLNAVMAGRDYRDALLIPDSAANAALIDAAKESLETMQAYTDSMAKTWPHQLTDKSLLEEYDRVNSEWRAIAENVISLYERYQSTGDATYLEQANKIVYEQDTPMLTEMATAAENLDAYLVSGMDAERTRIEKNVLTTIFVVIAAMVVATIFVIALVLTIIRGITVPTAQVHGALVGFSQGKFDIPVDFSSKNELGEMAQALRDSQDCLKTVVGEVSYLLGEMAKGNFALRFKDESVYVGGLIPMREAIREINYQLSDTLAQITMSAEQVSSGSEQVSVGAQALAQGATEQASAVEELSATITDISNNAQKNAKGSEEAMERTSYASSQLDESAHNMNEMVSAMDNISNSSQEIGKIIATIENIAFQTNILALNAAVEAARAGSAGKGFAVVAGEVRNLAAKSDEAAKATKELINRSINAVEDGNEIVKKVSDSLKRTVDATEELKKSISGIAKAVEEEAEAIAQVTEGIDQISSVVQTNSATSEESAAASEELSSQATLIKELMLKFKLRSGASGYTEVAELPAAAEVSEDTSGYTAGAASNFDKY